ncbi:unnamed protein product [Ceutorhynchus assimilis]|uniref:OTU domain-containing protein n=1 Tax=Ceutorhynchus assimilis TaxID=467358 RepID=A0A9N9MEZ2_9CUCU|nr:unnamed protein product [Ceutorhynchus assimilis]
MVRSIKIKASDERLYDRVWRGNLQPGQKDNNPATSLDNPKTYTLSDIVGDGSCLFRAVSMYLYGHQKCHEQLKKIALGYIKENWSVLQDHALIENDRMRDIEIYYENMKKTSVYGTSLEILALSETLSINFHINTRPEPEPE